MEEWRHYCLYHRGLLPLCSYAYMIRMSDLNDSEQSQDIEMKLLDYAGNPQIMSHVFRTVNADNQEANLSAAEEEYLNPPEQIFIRSSFKLEEETAAFQSPINQYELGTSNVVDTDPRVKMEDLSCDTNVPSFKQEVKEEKITPEELALESIYQYYRVYDSSVVDENQEIGPNDSTNAVFGGVERNFRTLPESISHPTPIDNVKYTCTLCDMEFSHPAHLNQHQLRHDSFRDFHCDKCGQSFVYHSLLKKHMVSRHSIKAFSCDKCDKKYNRKDHLKVHQRTHDGVKNHSCDVCSFKTASRNTLKDHVAIHTGIKRHECNVCKMRFTQSGSLSTHLLTHTGVKDFVCDICDKRFSRKTHLRTHIYMHIGFKKIKCSKCSMKFLTTDKVASHMLTHTGARNHACDICSGKFATRCGLQRHRLTHSDVRKFSCFGCDLTFTQSCSLDRHLRVGCRFTL